MATAKCRWSLKSCSLADRQKSGPISLLRLPFWLPGVSQAIAPHLESWLAEHDQCDRPHAIRVPVTATARCPSWPRHPLSEWGTSESRVSPWSRPVASVQPSGQHPPRGDSLHSSVMPVGGLSERRSIRSSHGTWRAGLPSTTSAAGRSGIMLKKSSVGF
jgi:hypothetical protein